MATQDRFTVFKIRFENDKTINAACHRVINSTAIRPIHGRAHRKSPHSRLGLNVKNITLPYTKAIVCLFDLLLYVPSQQLWSWRDNKFTQLHFFLGKLEQAVNQYFVHILSLITDNNPSIRDKSRF